MAAKPTQEQPALERVSNNIKLKILQRYRKVLQMGFTPEEADITSFLVSNETTKDLNPEEVRRYLSDRLVKVPMTGKEMTKRWLKHGTTAPRSDTSASGSTLQSYHTARSKGLFTDNQSGCIEGLWHPEG